MINYRNVYEFKKCIGLTVIATLLIGISAFAQSLSPQRYGPNLVKNGSFENGPNGWNIPKNSAKVVNDIFNSGEHSLCYVNNDPQKYVLFSQEIEAKPGQRLYFSAKVRGENLDASQAKSIYASGAGIYVQSSQEGKFISGSYPPHYNGTFNWKEINASYTVPPDATTVSVGLYLRKGVVGAAWFDDVEVRVEEPPACASFLQFPNYRGMVEEGNNSPWKIQVRVIHEPELNDAKINVITTLTDRNEKVLLEDQAQITASENTGTISLNPPKDLPVGKYALAQRFVDLSGRTLFTSEKTIQVVKKMPQVYIDDDGFTVVKGQRFFPMGLYLSTSEEDMKRASEGGFNTIINYSHGDNNKYKTYMDRAAQYNLKVLYAINKLYPGLRDYGEEAYKKAAGLINGIRNEPALLAWYTNDELETSFVPKLLKGYNQIKKLDVNHPAVQVYNNINTVEQYFDTTDIMAPDPYPVGKKGSNDLTQTGNSARAVKQAAHLAKGMWLVPQMMDWSVYRKGWESHPPSLDEMRNQAYQALINGAKGLIWYTYYDIKYTGYPRSKDNIDMDLFHRRWKDVTRMAKEIDAFIPTILKDEKISLDLPQNTAIEAAAWKQDNKLALVLANPYYREKSITFALPQGWTIQEADQGQIKSTFTDGKATFTLPEVGSGVFYLDKK